MENNVADGKLEGTLVEKSLQVEVSDERKQLVNKIEGLLQQSVEEWTKLVLPNSSVFDLFNSSVLCRIKPIFSAGIRISNSY